MSASDESSAAHHARDVVPRTSGHPDARTSRIERIIRPGLRRARVGSPPTAVGKRVRRTRVLLAVLTRITAEAITQALAPCLELMIIGSAVAGEVPESIRRLKPDVMIMDFTARLVPRLLIASGIAKTQNGVKVVGILPPIRARHMGLLLRSGILGLLDRNANASELIRAVGEAAAGRCYVSAGYGASMRAGFAGLGTRSFPKSPESLSEREEEVLNLITRGFTSREVGDRLFISPRTVENHIAELYRKLGLHNSHQLSCEVYQDEETEPPLGEE